MPHPQMSFYRHTHSNILMCSGTRMPAAASWDVCVIHICLLHPHLSGFLYHPSPTELHAVRSLPLPIMTTANPIPRGCFQMLSTSLGLEHDWFLYCAERASPLLGSLTHRLLGCNLGAARGNTDRINWWLGCRVQEERSQRWLVGEVEGIVSN